MLKSCPSCGAQTHPGARYCRRCGAPLRVAAGGSDNGTETVSPQAATVPLTEDTRTTDGLAPDDPRRAALDTARVNRAELDAILRTGRAPEHAPDLDTTVIESERGTPADYHPGDGASTDTSELELTSVPPDDSGFMTRPVVSGEFDEELTITVPRVPHPFDNGETPVRVELLDAAGHVPVGEATIPARSSQPAPTPAPPRRRWPLVVGACAAVLLVVTAAALLASRFWPRPAPTEVSTVAPVAPPDARQLFDEKMAQAEALLASGDMDGAVARLREANELDPSNTKAHRRLGEILLDRGARLAAIEEFRAVVQNSPEDFTAWRALASAQFAEGLYRDAAESYRRLVALAGETTADPNDLLSYADAMRLSGRADEAVALYKRLASAPVAEVANMARQHLAELAQPSPTPTATPKPGAETREEQAGALNPSVPQNNNSVPEQTQPTPAPTPAPQPSPPPRAVNASPAEQYRRGVELWASNRGAAVNEFLGAARGGSVDANYYLGLSLIEGKEMRNLKRAEVVGALQYFQIAQRGQFAAQSRRYVQQLEKEFDRLQRQR